MKGNKKKKLLEPIFHHLPEEIIFEIVSRLPLRCRLKFRCVCKSWSIRFNNHKQIMLTCGSAVYTLDNDSLTSPLLDGFKRRIKRIESSVASTELVTPRSFSFVGSCNGLICVDPPLRKFFLWNPSTDEYKHIPFSPSEYKDYPKLDDLQGSRMHGFGYEMKSDDYKFVRITSYLLSNQSKVEIYSLRLNAWKQIQYIPYIFNDFHSQEYGVFCNGALHWFAEEESELKNQSSSSSKVLISLDMTDEITREIPQPDDLDVNNYMCRRIDELDGCLCMLYSDSDIGFRVWVMKDYGKRESWTKIYFIPKLEFRKRLPLWYLRKIEYLKTGEMLLQGKFKSSKPDRKDLVLYNPTNGRAKVLKFEGNSKRSNSKAVFQKYEKSLVSLHSGTYFRDNVQA